MNRRPTRYYGARSDARSASSRARIWTFVAGSGTTSRSWKRNDSGSQAWRHEILRAEPPLALLAERSPTRYAQARTVAGDDILRRVEQRVTLLALDRHWSKPPGPDALEPGPPGADRPGRQESAGGVPSRGRRRVRPAPIPESKTRQSGPSSRSRSRPTASTGSRTGSSALRRPGPIW